ncbi:PH domain-containing protein [Streptomyces sp. NPDC058739]|uniref:PH domain-containing protein n=1 Tax=Streptomyces sp. NPDC058739 TaxID=3346618 RepID=UPI0036B15ED6
MTTNDRIYRSPMALVGGVLLLALAAWLGIDAMVQGEGNTPWQALGGLLTFVPVVVAFTVRPAVFADDNRLRVRNPLRVVTLPWGEIVSLRSGYTNEAVDKEGRKVQLWAIPVSLRGRKRAAKRQQRRDAQESAAAQGKRVRGSLFGPGGDVDDGPLRDQSDKIMDELRAMHEAREKANTSQGEVTVRWAYEIIAPTVVGVVLLVVFGALG